PGSGRRVPTRPGRNIRPAVRLQRLSPGYERRVAMRSKTWTALGAGAFALALAAGPAMAQGQFSAWDRDGDGRIDSTDFDRGFGTTTFDQWDRDGDGVLSRSEFNAGVYQAY